MDDWWYADGDKKAGPVSTDALRELYKRGKIARTTLVWQVGLESWIPFSDSTAFASLLPIFPPPLPIIPPPIMPPPAVTPPVTKPPITKPPPGTNAEHDSTMPLAKSWKRFFARIFDLWWETLVVSLLGGFILGYGSPAFAQWIQKPGSAPLFGLLCVPVALIFEVIPYSLFGNTLGKALLKVKVFDFSGKPMSAGNYLARNLSLWIYGLGFSIPFVTLFTMLAQGRKVSKGLKATYDQGTGANVYAMPLGIIRGTVFGIAFILLLFSFVNFRQ